ncbi:MAG: GTP cyclohydrolase I FolE [Bacteroidales bacterium]|nr:GTP cyclohydrolase I FolE [Bacteroidales bacterium]MBN2819342.1 GTP cyclohydrolase I FolE [Bacteroidales bacterium]
MDKSVLKELENEGYSLPESFDNEKTNKIAHHYKEILKLLEEDVNREGLKQTPVRFAKSIQFLTHGMHEDPVKILESSKFKEDYNHMLLVKDIEIYSMCEHHMLPFFGKAHVAYIPNGHITGLSKIARIVDVFARRLQVQERLTVQIRDCIHEAIQPLGVAVVIEARHLCMTMRGIQKQNSTITTSAFKGAFMKNPKTREEFMDLIGKKS